MSTDRSTLRAIRNRMLTDLGVLRAMSLPRFVAYLVAVGGLAGLLSWLLVLGLRLVFEGSGPTVTSLIWAIPRGALFAVVLGLVLRWYWRRGKGRDASEREP